MSANVNVNSLSWDSYFISIADTVRLKSKDGSSKVGAILVGPQNQVVSTGFNGFPRGIDETDQTRWERPEKYQYVEHAERNAIYNAARHGIALEGCTLYLVGFGPPSVPCIDCTRAIIQSGIKTVIGYAYKAVPQHWVEDLVISRKLLEEAGVEFKEHLA